MTDFSAFTDTAEKLLEPALVAFFNSVYPSDRLISHGLEHHRRVWKYAKELLPYTENNTSVSALFIQKLLIACYLHDIGMAIDPGVKHGKYSMELSVQFLHEQNLDASSKQDILSAIENHDDKEYSDKLDSDILLKILTIADDLDAFGHIGVLRYSEIYLARGVKIVSICSLVMENAEKRFTNFEKTYNSYPELVRKHRRRYDELNVFFRALSTELNK